MPTPPIPPFFIFTSPPPLQRRECIVVDSKVYCREEGTSLSETGWDLLFVLITVCYVLALFHLATEVFDNGWILVIGLLVPALLTIAYLITH